MEISLYEDDEFPFTMEWYKSREHAPHLEQTVHQERMRVVAQMAASAIADRGYQTVVDIGAGDGGLLSLLHTYSPSVSGWGYDAMPVNCAHARDVRGVDVRYLDFVNEPIDWGDLTITTECLEHLEDPHAMVRRIGMYSRAIIASSPARETAESHDACHAWCWDELGYADLIEQGGFEVVAHRLVQGGFDFQVILGVMP